MSLFMLDMRNRVWKVGRECVGLLSFKWVLIMIVSFLSVPMAYGFWLLARAFVFDYFTIPSESMSPTLKPGDKVVVNKLWMGARIYTDFVFDVNGQELKAFRLKGTRGVRRNDIVVFNLANHDGKINFVINNVFCKRVLALPGDSIGAVNGHYVNNNYDEVLGLEAEQTRLENTPDSLIYGLWMLPYDWHVGWSIKNFGPMYVPRKGDMIDVTAREAVIYQLLLEWELGKKVTWDWDRNDVYADGKRLHRHVFKHDYYFMAGDNVINSNDSRYWGLVPEEYIVGVVMKSFSEL